MGLATQGEPLPYLSSALWYPAATAARCIQTYEAASRRHRKRSSHWEGRESAGSTVFLPAVSVHSSELRSRCAARFPILEEVTKDLKVGNFAKDLHLGDQNHG